MALAQDARALLFAGSIEKCNWAAAGCSGV
jgi:hypothetical protein